MARKFECIGLEEIEAGGWNDCFEIGKVYDEVNFTNSRGIEKPLDDEGALLLRTTYRGYAVSLIVDADQFKEVQDEEKKDSGSPDGGR